LGQNAHPGHFDLGAARQVLIHPGAPGGISGIFAPERGKNTSKIDQF